MAGIPGGKPHIRVARIYVFCPEGINPFKELRTTKKACKANVKAVQL